MDATCGVGDRREEDRVKHDNTEETDQAKGPDEGEEDGSDRRA